MAGDIFHLTSAGSVDDGKSTILARLLLDTGSVFEDQLGGINPRSVDATTIADLLDGLDSEREQGITIDVAHRFFDSNTRRYHLADSPGHEQYTKNMATAASHADGMLLVVDARVGVKPQTVTHLGIARMFGIKQFVVAVNKMDLVGFKKNTFHKLKESIEDLFAGTDVTFVTLPVSGLTGDNIARESRRMSWWAGGTVLSTLDDFRSNVPTTDTSAFSVQHVQRIAGGGRRYLGSLVSGQFHVGDVVTSPRYGHKTFKIVELANSGRTVQGASAPAETALRIDTEIDLERGDTLAVGDAVLSTSQFEADLVWFDDEPGFAGRSYILRLGHATTKSTMTRIFEIDASDYKLGATNQVTVNSRVRANFDTHTVVSMARFEEVPELGRFVLVDPDSGRTVAAGIINHTLRRADNLVEHEFAVPISRRSMLTGREGRVLWFTGLSGSGKSTLSDACSVSLTDLGVAHAVLDGDSLRLSLNRDLGFTEEDRIENIRRTSEVARMMADSGLVVLVSLISPYLADRELARTVIGDERFVEVFVDTPLEVCEARDEKGLYKKARAGLIPNFTGVGAPYEQPVNASLRITSDISRPDAVRQCLGLIGL